jgi:hypothetical protein
MTSSDRVTELIREEADHYQPGDGLDGIARRLDVRRRRRRTRHRLGVGLAVVVAGVITAVIVVGGGRTPSQDVSVGGNGSAPAPVVALADPSLTPKGWSPVEFDDIQVSVPSSWSIEYPGMASCGEGSGGVASIGKGQDLPVGAGCPTGANVANVVSIAAAMSQRLERARHIVVNGIPTVQGITGGAGDPTMVERARGDEVEARGPDARQVLATLTHSPLSVVIDSATTSVPKDWRTINYAGLRFAVPASWKVADQAEWQCLSTTQADTVVLEPADSTGGESCTATPLNTAGTWTAKPGLVVASGPALPPSLADATCRTRAQLRICIDPPFSAVDDRPGVMTVQIARPGQAHPDRIEIGLAGTGQQAAQIFESIAATPNASGTAGPAATTGSPGQPSVTTTLELSSQTMRAGGTMHATIIIENRTGHALHTEGCGSIFQVTLTNAGDPGRPVWPLCLQRITIPAGHSTQTLDVHASFYLCGASGVPACTTRGLSALPPGNYEATTYESTHTVPVPAPKPVQVTQK